MGQINIFGSFVYSLYGYLAFSFLLMCKIVSSKHKNFSKTFRGETMAKFYNWVLPELAF